MFPLKWAKFFYLAEPKIRPRLSLTMFHVKHLAQEFSESGASTRMNDLVTVLLTDRLSVSRDGPRLPNLTLELVARHRHQDSPHNVSRETSRTTIGLALTSDLPQTENGEPRCRSLSGRILIRIKPLRGKCGGLSRTSGQQCDLSDQAVFAPSRQPFMVSHRCFHRTSNDRDFILWSSAEVLRSPRDLAGQRWMRHRPRVRSRIPQKRGRFDGTPFRRG